MNICVILRHKDQQVASAELNLDFILQIGDAVCLYSWFDPYGSSIKIEEGCEWVRESMNKMSNDLYFVKGRAFTTKSYNNHVVLLYFNISKS
jgi:hypothetical protein